MGEHSQTQQEKALSGSVAGIVQSASLEGEAWKHGQVPEDRAHISDIPLSGKFLSSMYVEFYQQLFFLMQAIVY